MSFSDDLLLQKRRQKRGPSPEEPMEQELARPKHTPLNQNEGVFQKDKPQTFSGINSKPPVLR